MCVKPNRGSFILLLISILWLPLCAEDFSYTITPSKSDPYLKEPILLHVDLNQTNPEAVLLFQFSVNPSDAYKVRLLNARHEDTLHHASIENTYELYPLRTGDINVTFSLIKRVTNEAKVRYFSSGDRDDFKKLETEDFPVTVPPLRLHVQPLPKGTQIVGEYTLEYHIKRHKTAAFTPIPMRITIHGKGYPPILKHLLPKSDAYKLFEEKPIVETITTPQGSLHKVRYLYALSAKESFDLPAVTLHAFNPFTHTSYTLQIPSQHFEIDPVATADLVDKVDNPKPLQFDAAWMVDLLGYLAAFGAGYLTALLWSRRIKKDKTDSSPLQQRIARSNDAKSLLQILLAANDPRYRDAIDALEAHLYRGAPLSLKKLKETLKEPNA